MNKSIESVKHLLPVSVLTKSQVKTFTKENVTIDGVNYRKVAAKVRYDDQCSNGHNSFAITGSAWEPRNFKANDPDTCGCIHEIIAEAFPELAPFIKWHLVSSDGPMHYIANTTYHALQHDIQKGWAYLVDPANKINNCLTYCKLDSKELKDLQDTYGDKIIIKPDAKTAKTANFEAARSCAVWPEATEQQLQDEAALLERLPALMAEFKKDVESLGFVY